MTRIITMDEEIERHRVTPESRADHSCVHVTVRMRGDDEPVYVHRHTATGRRSFLCRTCLEFALHAEAWQAVRQ